MWIYCISTGELSYNWKPVALGYSGAPEAKNDLTKCNIPNVGPIPPGIYKIGSPFKHPHKGDACMRLTPDETNIMFGRDGFMIHGESIEHPGAASEGCIILSRFARERIINSNDRTLRVIAEIGARVNG